MKTVSVANLVLHPEAGVVPEMPADQYAAFLADVKTRGVRKPVELIPGTLTVIDGRTRLRAAREAGFDTIPVEDADLRGDDPVVYMLRAAITRRHLSSSQNAALAVEIEARLAKGAKERQRAAGGDRGNQHTKARQLAVQEIFPEPPTADGEDEDEDELTPAPKARDVAATATGTNPRYVSDAKAIQASDPGLLDKVKTGELTIPQAKQEVRRREKLKELETKAAAVTPGRATGWEVVQGECVEALTARDPGTARLVFADPPYNFGFEYDGDPTGDKLPEAKYLDFTRRWVAACHRVLSPDGSLWLLTPSEWADSFGLILRDCGFRRRSWVVWYESFGVNNANNFNRCARHLLYCVKNPADFVFHHTAVSRPSDRQVKYNDARANPFGKILDDVWFDIPRLTGTAAERIPEFPTQLPLALLRRIVGCCSDPGDLVVDPFNGSGTTGVASVESGRRYLGIERSARYAELSRMRLKGTSHGPPPSGTRT